MASSDASSRKRLQTCESINHTENKAGKRQLMKLNLGHCMEDEVNIKELEDVQQELSGKLIQTKRRTIIHFHHRLRCFES